MKVESLALPGVLLVTPRIHTDSRGAFHESWHRERYAAAGLPEAWAQDNVSRSRRGVLRGLHFQHPRAQGKLVWAVAGEILDVAVDIRRGSPTFGAWTSAVLRSSTAQQLYIPPGFAHGFLVLSDEAVVQYKCTDVYVPECERTIAWNDPQLGIEWPVAAPIVSDRDARAARLSELSADDLPAYDPTP